MADRYRTGRKLGTTVYRNDEDQPCGWFPGDRVLAAVSVDLLNDNTGAALHEATVFGNALADQRDQAAADAVRMARLVQHPHPPPNDVPDCPACTDARAVIERWSHA